jgi:hypothetical protein
MGESVSGCIELREEAPRHRHVQPSALRIERLDG